MAETFSAWRLDGWREPAVLITSELVTNAVQHAGTDLTVSIVKGRSEVVIEVTDRAPYRDVRAGAGSGDLTGGVGLVIVERLAEEWGVDRRPNRKSVWARLAVGAGAPRPAGAASPAGSAGSAGQSRAASPYQSRHTTTASSSASASR